MVEILEQCIRFQTTSLADQVKTILKKGWCFDLEISGIHQRIKRESRQQESYSINDALNFGKIEQSHRNTRKVITTETPHTQTTQNK